MNKTSSDLKIAMRHEAETLYCMVYPVDDADIDEPITPTPPGQDTPETTVKPSEDEPIEKEDELYTVYRCKEYINLRKSAFTSSESIAKIPLGVVVLALLSDGSLYKA